MSALIDPSDLKELLMTSGNIKIFDATYPLAQADTYGIKGAQAFDIDAIAAPNSSLPHTLPSAELFTQKMQLAGLNKDDLVIVYDQKGIALAAARAWWMLRTFGHHNVKILNGGRPAWLAAGYELFPMTMPTKNGDFQAVLEKQLVKSASEIFENIDKNDFTLVDVRINQRFTNDGHIPHSVNLFFMDCINPETGSLKNQKDLRLQFEQAKISFEQPLVFSCGSGVTACIGALAAYELGHKGAGVFDGSWCEWTSKPQYPIAK